MQYPASFVMYALNNFLVSIIELFGVYAMFSRFEKLGDWTLSEVMIFYGMTYMAFALSEAYMRVFDTIDRHIRTGEFDRVLMRPRGTFLQVLGSEFQLFRVGRFLNGLLPFVAGVIIVQPRWNFFEWALVIISVAAGSLTYGGVMLLRAFASFFTVESLEVFNIFTHGGVSMSAYPMNIYSGWLRRLFTFVIPLAAINYWPMAVLLDRDYAPVWVSWSAPLLGVVFFGIGVIAWNFGVRHYRSTGS